MADAVIKGKRKNERAKGGEKLVGMTPNMTCLN